MCDFTELNDTIKKNQSALLRYAACCLKCRPSAEDAVQEAFIRYVKYLRNPLNGRIENLTAWLFRTTRNICLDHLRSARVKSEQPLDETVGEKEFSTFEAPDNQSVQNDDVRLMRSLIKNLSLREQELLTLKFDHSKSYREIAEIMDLTVSNVGFILHHAIRKLKTEYRKTTSGGEE